MLSTIVSFLLQFSLFTLALGAPTGDFTVQETAWQYGTGGGIIGLIVLVLDIIVARKYHLLRGVKACANKFL